MAGPALMTAGSAICAESARVARIDLTPRFDTADWKSWETTSR
jgi:hypothetical protein